jgi:hypothetical protein
MSIIRLEWEDAVAALLNMLCKDRIHDYGKYSGGFGKGLPKLANDIGLTGGSDILDQAIKIQVLDALYNQILLNNEGEENNNYCITKTDIDTTIMDVVRGINRDQLCYLFICKTSNILQESLVFKHYIISDEEVNKDDQTITNISKKLFFNNKICIDISNIKFFIKSLCDKANLTENNYSYIIQQLLPQFVKEIERLRNFLYSFLDKLNLHDKLILFFKLAQIYDTIDQGNLIHEDQIVLDLEHQEKNMIHFHKNNIQNHIK